MSKKREDLISEYFVDMCKGSINPDSYAILVDEIVPQLSLARNNLKPRPDEAVKAAGEFMDNYVQGELTVKDCKPASFAIIEKLIESIR